jgi:hypothetical protein
MKYRLRVVPALLGVALASDALAHDPPQGTGILWAPGDTKTTSTGADAVVPERMLIQTNRGLMVSSDGQASFQYLCSDVIWGTDTTPTPILVASDGQLAVATFVNGLVTGSADLCDWHSATGPLGGGAATFDVVAVPGQPRRRYVLASTAPSSTGLFRSDDAGATWTAVGDGQVPYTRVRVAPSDPNRIYRSAVDVAADATLVHKLSVSTDGGNTAVEHLIPLGSNELQARLLAVDPGDPDRVYLHVEATSLELPERLIVTTDAGKSFATLATMTSMNGFTMSPDGLTLWVGGAEGLWRSRDRGAHFESIPGSGLTRVGCLDAHAGRLYACGVTEGNFDISVSSDDGESFQRLLAFADVKTGLACPDSSSVGLTCAGPTIHFRQEVAPPPTDPPASSAGAAGAGGQSSGNLTSGAGATFTGAGAVPSAAHSGGCDLGEMASSEADPIAILAATAALLFGILSRPPRTTEAAEAASRQHHQQQQQQQRSASPPSSRPCPSRGRSRVYPRIPHIRPGGRQSLWRPRVTPIATPGNRAETTIG